MRRFCLALLATTIATPALFADVKLASVFSDHMVIQRDKPVTIWGWAQPGEKIQVAWSTNDGKTGKGLKEAATADKDGNWSVHLGPFKSGGNPLWIEFTGKESKATLKDVLVGEVWVCSGQSNMQWAVTQSKNPKEEVANGNHPQIRLFYVPRVPAGAPVKNVNAKWEICSPKTVGRFSAVSYYFGRKLQKELGVPIGLIHTSWGGTRIEPWTPISGFKSVESMKSVPASLDAMVARWEKAAAAAKEAGKKPPRHPLNSAGRPTGLYNGMIAPLIPFSIRGAIWYQGESNRGNGLAYEQMMHALINGWRKEFKQGDFPFYYVQLAPYRYGGRVDLLPLIWEAQTNVLKMKNTGMAVTTDIGNVRDIHPKNKQDVGKRLALWALAKTYGKKDIVYSGPLYKSKKIEGSTIRLSFDHVGGGLVSRDGKPLSWFTIAGEGGKFVAAKAEIDGDEVVVSAESVKNPQHVRFGWHQLAEPNLSNKAGLPASPFRTDRGGK